MQPPAGENLIRRPLFLENGFIGTFDTWIYFSLGPNCFCKDVLHKQFESYTVESKHSVPPFSLPHNICVVLFFWFEDRSSQVNSHWFVYVPIPCGTTC